jgi:DNA-binding MarR family transcriptional regulator
VTGPAVDPRLVLSAPELDAALEQALLAEAVLWTAADDALSTPMGSPGASTLGRGHWRAAFLIRRRPGLGVKELAALTGLSKQGASRVLKELEAAGMIAKGRPEPGLGEDARRRPAALTEAGAAFEAHVAARLHAALARAYRAAGVEHAGGARRVWASLAGARPTRREPAEEPAA